MASSTPQNSEQPSHIFLDVEDDLNTSLHVAASIGLSGLARQITYLKPQLALSFNRQGRTPLHVAVSNGHLQIVRELLRSMTAGHELCRVPDKDGFLPVHTAAASGRVGILVELAELRSDSGLREKTQQGDSVLHLAVKSGNFEAVKFDSVLHLAVKSGNFEAVKFLVEKAGDDHELFVAKDAEGNSILHLAAAMGQAETLTFLITKPWADANSLNNKGLTVLDVLLQSPTEHRATMEETIRAAGGRITREHHHERSSCVWLLRVKQWLHLDSLEEASLREQEEHKNSRNSRNIIMVIATLIATVTFQAGVAPPSIGSDGTPRAPPPMKESYVMEDLDRFLVCDAIALISSLSVVLLINCWSRRKCMTRLLMWITWIAVFFTGVAFLIALTLMLDVKDNHLPRVMRFGQVCIAFAAALSGFLAARLLWSALGALITCLKRSLGEHSLGMSRVHHHSCGKRSRIAISCGKRIAMGVLFLLIWTSLFFLFTQYIVIIAPFKAPNE